MFAVLTASLLVMLGGRFLGKGARFHNLEREHLAAVMWMELALRRVVPGDAAAAAADGKAVLLKEIEHATWITQQGWRGTSA